jgi:hypothetical protein
MTALLCYRGVVIEYLNKKENQ